MKNNFETNHQFSKKYITGFNGIRSLAVIGVILYHLFPEKMVGGYLGVVVFFGLSGYLITESLLHEWQKDQTIHLKRFYVRRLKRLYPAMTGMFLVTITYMTLFQRNLLDHIRGVLLSSLTYLNNWWQIFNKQSYFAHFGNESPFTHIWSLAIEGQFYFFGPLLLVFVLKIAAKQKKLIKRHYFVYGLSFLAVASAAVMAILYTPHMDPSRVYYGTDTRIFSLWIGCLLAFLWPSRRLKKNVSELARRVLDIAGALALFGVILGLLFLGSQTSFTYYGGMFLYSLIAACLIAITAHPGADLNRWLTNPVFTYLGQRSYGIYLYQYPVMIFYEAKITNLAQYPYLHAAIELVLILICSELSYRFIEKPFQKVKFKNLWTELKIGTIQQWPLVKKLIGALFLLVIAINLIGIFGKYGNGENSELQSRITANAKVSTSTTTS